MPYPFIVPDTVGSEAFYVDYAGHSNSDTRYELFIGSGCDYNMRFAILSKKHDTYPLYMEKLVEDYDNQSNEMKIGAWREGMKLLSKSLSGLFKITVLWPLNPYEYCTKISDDQLEVVFSAFANSVTSLTLRGIPLNLKKSKTLLETKLTEIETLELISGPGCDELARASILEAMKSLKRIKLSIPATQMHRPANFHWRRTLYALAANPKLESIEVINNPHKSIDLQFWPTINQARNKYRYRDKNVPTNTKSIRNTDKNKDIKNVDNTDVPMVESCVAALASIPKDRVDCLHYLFMEMVPAYMIPGSYTNPNQIATHSPTNRTKKRPDPVDSKEYESGWVDLGEEAIF